MRVFHIAAGKVIETDALPETPASTPTAPGFILKSKPPCKD